MADRRSVRLPGRLFGATLGLLILGIVLATPVAAQQNGQQGRQGEQQGQRGGQNGQQGQQGQRGGQNGGSRPSPAATPELSSLVLFGAGATGLASYGLMQLRAARRRRL